MPIPPARIPHLNLPEIRGVPFIPHTGKAAASATVLVGEQFGNIPDASAVVSIKAVKKALEEQMWVLVNGQLSDFFRPPVFAARLVTITEEVADIVATFNAVVSAIESEVNSLIDSINDHAAELESARSAILSIPADARTAFDDLMVIRYAEYIEQLEAQAARHQEALDALDE